MIRSFQTLNSNSSADRTGAMLPMVGVTTVILFVACAFAVDIARMHLTRSELRTSTDAAARAAVEALGRVNNTQGATDAAIAIAKRNVVAGSGLTLDPNNIIFGNSTRDENGKFIFAEDSTSINSVQIRGERTQDSPDGPVALMFGPLLGRGTFSPSMSSTALRVDRDIALVLDKSGSMSSNEHQADLQASARHFGLAWTRSRMIPVIVAQQVRKPLF